ncbi:hypothetical protein J6590_052955 [Homalodisca vitripennis]|nr:hypothetical protein J6590_052955 [Homalodisca vitripennis]
MKLNGQEQVLCWCISNHGMWLSVIEACHTVGVNARSAGKGGRRYPNSEHHPGPARNSAASTKDPSLPIQNSDHAMLARCAALCAACSFRKKKLTRACKVQAQINSPRFIEHKTQTEVTQVSLQAKDKRRAFITDKIRRVYTGSSTWTTELNEKDPNI